MNALLFIAEKLHVTDCCEDFIVYEEPNPTLYLFFISKGKFSFFLPVLNNASFHTIEQGTIVGLEDFIYSLFALLHKENKELDVTDRK